MSMSPQCLFFSIIILTEYGFSLSSHYDFVVPHDYELNILCLLRSFFLQLRNISGNESISLINDYKAIHILKGTELYLQRSLNDMLYRI